MMRSKGGFFLVEWMVQFLLLTTVALISYSLIASWHRTVVRINSLCNELLPAYIATDIMRSDIHEAKKIKIDNDNILLNVTHDYRAITWYCKEHRLLRSISSYDQKEQRWLKPSYGLIAQHIIDSKCSSPPGDAEHIMVHVKTEHGPDNTTLVTSMRNGLIL